MNLYKKLIFQLSAVDVNFPTGRILFLNHSYFNIRTNKMGEYTVIVLCLLVLIMVVAAQRDPDFSRRGEVQLFNNRPFRRHHHKHHYEEALLRKFEHNFLTNQCV